MARTVLTASDLTLGTSATQQQRIDNVRTILDAINTASSAGGGVVELPVGVIECESGTPTSGSAHSGEIEMKEGVRLEGGGAAGIMDSGGGKATRLSFFCEDGMRCIKAEDKVRGCGLRGLVVQVMADKPTTGARTNVIAVDLAHFWYADIDGVGVQGSLYGGDSQPYDGTVGFYLNDQQSGSECFGNRLTGVTVYRMETAFKHRMTNGTVDYNSVRNFASSDTKYGIWLHSSANIQADYRCGYLYTGTVYTSGDKAIYNSSSGTPRCIFEDISVEGFTDAPDMEIGAVTSRQHRKAFAFNGRGRVRGTDWSHVLEPRNSSPQGHEEATPLPPSNSHPYPDTRSAWIKIGSGTNVYNGYTAKYWTKYDQDAGENTNIVPVLIFKTDGGLGGSKGAFSWTVDSGYDQRGTTGEYYQTYTVTLHMDPSVTSGSPFQLTSDMVGFLAIQDTLAE